MNKSPDKKKKELLGRVGRLFGGLLTETQARLAREYLEYYFRRVPMEELERETPQALAGVIASQLGFLARRLPGQTLIRVYNPSAQKHGWESAHTIIEMVNDDKPFLVDSATIALAEMNLDVH
jgi:glutamate dehydrogenase